LRTRDLKPLAAIVAVLAGAALYVALDVWNGAEQATPPTEQQEGAASEGGDLETGDRATRRSGTGPAAATRTGPGAREAPTHEAGSRERAGGAFEQRSSSGAMPGTGPEAQVDQEGRGPSEPTELGEPEDEEPEEEEPGDSSLVVLLLNPDGDGVPDARISIQSKRTSKSLVTGSRGNAFFSNLPAGSYSYSVRAPGREPLASNARIELQEGESRTITLRLGEEDLSISGRVLNRRGQPVGGLEVIATRQIGSSGTELVPAVRGDYGARTQGDGFYQIEGLAEGPYRVSTTETDRYPSATTLVRAGVDSADLVVDEGAPVRVYGTVTNTRGEGLEGVRVVPLGGGTPAVRTGENGSYEVLLTVRGRGGVPYFEFILKGYRSVRSKPPGDMPAPGAEIRLDARMEEGGQTVRVTGNVRSSYGDPVSGQRIRLFSPRLRRDMSTSTTSEGDFHFPNVEVSSDYQLIVRSTGSYVDYVQSPLEITGDRSLDIVLEPLATGLLTGRMVDPEGYPVESFRLWLRSDRARQQAIQVSGDASGAFVVEQAPEGNLHFETRASPHFRVAGIHLEAGARADVLVVLDRGNYLVEGRVLDTSGAPVGGADIQMSWSALSDGIRSSSVRRTASDASGWFRFTQIGAGGHLLDVRLTGYRTARVPYDVGGDSDPLEVRLARAPQ
jgi:protocatechuate 3,4-dioxygenase beta subunit